MFVFTSEKQTQILNYRLKNGHIIGRKNLRLLIIKNLCIKINQNYADNHIKELHLCIRISKIYAENKGCYAV
ncbi:MAG: hypothetical protein BWX74_00856 [Tenericutes bacterium ADurb.Bin087]|nr:MAG: hypothetical protein BWX74_00856 [Tenericutes bacterium ADurb.Bin087]